MEAAGCCADPSFPASPGLGEAGQWAAEDSWKPGQALLQEKDKKSNRESWPGASRWLPGRGELQIGQRWDSKKWLFVHLAFLKLSVCYLPGARHSRCGCLLLLLSFFLGGI